MKKTTEQIVHESHLREEIIFQLLVRNSAFKNIKVSELRDFARHASVQIGNFHFSENNSPSNKKVSDDEFNRSDFVVRRMLNE